jgi:dipeptidyl aminopeptidase/acylaminoacyl peptidase
MRTLLLVPLFFSADPLIHRTASAQQLTVPWIMKGPELVGREPTDVRWSPDGQYIWFRWLPPGSSWREPLATYRVRAQAGAVPERMTRQAGDTAAIVAGGGVTSPDRTKKVVSFEGDMWLVSLPAGTAQRLTQTPTISEQPLVFDPAGNTIYFQRDNAAVMAFDLTRGGVRQITDIRPGPAPDTGRTATGQRGFVEAENRALLGVLRDRRWVDSVGKAEREGREKERAKPFFLAREERIAQFSPSPMGTHILVVTTTSSNQKVEKVPNYITVSGYVEELDARTKVGDSLPRIRAFLYDVATGAVTWVKPDPNDTSARSFGAVNAVGWNDAGTSALLTVTTRDYTTRYLHRIDALDGRLTTLDVLRDTAWVNGPCFNCGGWLPGDQGVWFVSEASGWAHVYTVRPDGSGRQQLTSGNWEVTRANLSPDRTRFELLTSEESLFEQHYYTMPLTGGARTKLTSGVGGHAVFPSPDRSQLADVYSEANRPPELYLTGAQGAGRRARLTTSPTAEWSAFRWIKPEIVKIRASDGVDVPARIYRPADLGARPNGAAVIFVHGAGYLHNVHNYWSSYYREYMFHHLLAQKGYVVLDVDYRASAGYGRDWRTAIYRFFGGRDLQDHVDASKWLTTTYKIPPERIGIYGGSYGGFITLMALFQEGQYFGAGAALRSVTDWAHYNHPYTARIINEPQEDSIAYRRSSPIYFAEGLDDPLLIAHGMVDVNVHFLDVVRLAQRLIELGKTNWEMAVYPVEDHGFVRPDSWTDEYRRILELFERHLHPRTSR